MSNDEHHEDDFDEAADLRGDMAEATFHALDDWWHRLFASLDDEGRDKLVGGELTLGAEHGLAAVRLLPPVGLFNFDEDAAAELLDEE